MSAVETLLSVTVGAVMGFFGSIGSYRWKQGREKQSLKDRIRKDLRIILQEVTSDYEKEAFQSRAFFTEGFIALKQDLIRELDAKTLRAVLETYIKIDQLRFPSNDKDMNRTKYRETVDVVKKTIDLLKQQLS
jgi:hypothetical protein